MREKRKKEGREERVERERGEREDRDRGKSTKSPSTPPPQQPRSQGFTGLPPTLKTHPSPPPSRERNGESGSFLKTLKKILKTTIHLLDSFVALLYALFP